MRIDVRLFSTGNSVAGHSHFQAAAIVLPVTNNSVAADALAQPHVSHEVGPQPLARKSLEAKETIAQFESKHGSEHVAGLVNDRKQQLIRGKCASTNTSPSVNNVKSVKSEQINWFPKRNSSALLANQPDNMVAMQELATAPAFDDNAEELQYGPGIVSKLRCRYLSLALRQTVKQRPTLDNLRRANSMSNLLEEESVDIDEVDDRNGHNEQIETKPIPSIIQVEYSNGTHNGSNGQNEEEGKADLRRQVQRGNDSLKRARSVEALMRYDTLAWRRDVLEDSEDYPSSNPIILDEIIVSDYQSTVIKAKTADSITIEDKIQQARDRMNDLKPPRRLTSFMSDTERPPPDLVKQTLLKFEASANRRSRGGIQRYGNGDVAAKVATYKSKLSQSPPVTAKLPPSGFKKPLIKPRTTSPKPVAFLNGTKEPKKIYTKADQDNNDFNGYKLDVERMNQKNAIPLRVDTSVYRNKFDASPESPASSPAESPRPSYVYDMVRRRENNHSDSPLITQLARKTESMTLSTPRRGDVAFSTDESSVQPSDDDATSDSSETGWSESYDVNISDNENSDNEVRSKQNGIKPTVISVTPTAEKKEPEPSVRQIGIIRPLNHDAKPPVPIARKLPSPSASAKKESPDAIKVSVSAAPIVVSTQHSVVLPPSTSSVVVTNSMSVTTSNDVQGDVVVIECSGDSNIDNNRTKEPKTISIDTRSIVHQKNLLNKEKSEELMQSPIKWNIKKSTVVSSSPNGNTSVVVNQTPSPQPPKQRPTDIQATNTMVFNFSNRKDVPDYIENDGLVIRRKRELPKVSGVHL